MIKKKFTYKLAFIDSYKFMQSKLSDFVDNLFEINKKNFQNAWGKKLNWNVILLGQKIIDYVTDAKNVKTNAVSQ